MVALYIASIVIAGVVLGLHLRLFPWQWKCMYDEDRFNESCDHQCRFCREMERGEL